MLPRTERCSNDTGLLPLAVNFTFFMCVFMAWSTPVTVPALDLRNAQGMQDVAPRFEQSVGAAGMHNGVQKSAHLPWTTPPFLSSTVTLSSLSFMRNLEGEA